MASEPRRPSGPRRFYQVWEGLRPGIGNSAVTYYHGHTETPGVCRVSNGAEYVCTRTAGHRGPHIAHHSPSHICQDGIWDEYPDEVRVTYGL